MTTLKILVAPMMERVITEAAFWGFMAVAQRNYPLRAVPVQRVDMARNEAAAACLRGDYTHLCMLDADHVHPGDVVERLARWMIKDPAALIVGGLNFKRAAPFEPCAFAKDPEGNRCIVADWTPGLLEVEVVGTGCILIAREVFERISKPWFHYVYKEDGFSPSEDVTFCLKCQEAGIKVYCDTTTCSPHIAQIGISESHYRQYLQAHPEHIETNAGG